MTLSRVTPMNSVMINNSERARVLAKRGERERERETVTGFTKVNAS